MEQRRRKLKTNMLRVIRRWIAMACFIGLLTPTAVYAEGFTAKDYMERGIRSAYHNMHLLYKAYYDDEGNLEVQPAGHVAIEQEWDDEGRLISRTYLDADGQPMNRVDGYAKAVWEQNENGGESITFYGADGEKIESKGLNLAEEIDTDEEGWSDWFTPTYDEDNYIIDIGEFVLDEGNANDSYTCSIEIEFEDVTATAGMPFIFRTVGKVNQSWNDWNSLNIWNSSFIYLDSVPKNDVLKFTKTFTRTEEMSKVSTCNSSFRCDYWGSGSFRIRGLKIEKNESATEWTPGV